MPHAHLAYAPASDLPVTALNVSIFADHSHVREQLREDAEVAGLGVHECLPVSALVEGEPRALGEVVLLDCPEVDAAGMAALARLDARAARSGAHLVISTTVAGLDTVFACCDRSAPQILVDPNRAERVVALGRALSGGSRFRLRELSRDDRLALLRLTEQVGEIAERLDRLELPPGLVGDDKVFHLESPGRGFSGAPADDASRPLARPPLPDPRLLRRIIRQRNLRARFFEPGLFADPAWDMLLDLAAARAEHKRVSVTSLCIASGVPPTTALRWIGVMTTAGLLEREEDESDRRRVFITLSDPAADSMARFFAQLGRGGAQLV